jgi:Y_Y_Y domain
LVICHLYTEGGKFDRNKQEQAFITSPTLYLVFATFHKEKSSKLNRNRNFSLFFTLKFIALNYLNPDQTWFAYKLEGVDNDWRYTQDPKAVYTNVAGGNYTFRYKATADANDWNVPGLTNFVNLYQYLSNTPIEIIETETYFAVKIPLLMN